MSMVSSGSARCLIQRWNTGMSASTSTVRADSGVRKIFSCSLCASMTLANTWGRRSGAGRRGGGPQAGSEACITLVGGIHEQRRFLDQLVGRLAARRLAPVVEGAEEVLRELPARERVEEQLGLVEVLAELAHDLVGFVTQVRVLLARQRAGRQQHRRERPPGRPVDLLLV